VAEVKILCVNYLHSVTPWITLAKILFGVIPMTSLFHISLTTKTAHRTSADFGVRMGRVGNAWYAMRGPAALRTAIVEASRTANLDALAARGAG
jgi:hypothetical protein